MMLPCDASPIEEQRRNCAPREAYDYLMNKPMEFIWYNTKTEFNSNEFGPKQLLKQVEAKNFPLTAASG